MMAPTTRRALLGQAGLVAALVAVPAEGIAAPDAIWRQAVADFEAAEAFANEDHSDEAWDAAADMEVAVIKTPAPHAEAVAYKLFLLGRVLCPNIGDDFNEAKAKEWAEGPFQWTEKVVGTAYLELLRLAGSAV